MPNAKRVGRIWTGFVRFGYCCPRGHEIVEAHPIGQAPNGIFCTDHQIHATRVFEVPYYQEDRRGQSQPKQPNAPSDDWSWTLGGPRPKSRAEMKAIEKTMGIEFITPAEARADAQKLREGKNLDEPTKPEKGYLAKEVAKRGIRFDRSLSQPQQLTREQSERKLEAERGWTSSVESEAKTVSTDKLPA